MSNEHTFKKRTKLFDHFHVAETWREYLLQDLTECGRISTKEWDCFLKAQRKSALKKYPPKPRTGHEAERAATAKAKFLSVCDHLLSLPTGVFDDLNPYSLQRGLSHKDASKLGLEWVLARAQAVCRYILGNFSIEELFDHCRHGPGVSLGVPYGDTGNSRKWLPPWSATERIVPWFIHYLRYDPLLLESLWGDRASDVDVHDVWKYVEIVQSSRLTTVPKNDETDRCIAIEPTLNMFFQQGLGAVIAKRLKNYGIDIQYQQDLHRAMAEEASLTRSHATIDWSSASDCVSVSLLKYLLPPAWFDAVDRARCETVLVDGVTYTLPCIATMGNATTFVLETLVFLSLAMATIDPKPTRSLLVNNEDFKNVSVFGDDCIVPTESARRFIDACVGVGFIVNEDKTFTRVDDPFRESCGADFYGGYNVRPIYLKGPRSEKPSVLRGWLYIMWNVTSKRFKSSLGDRNYVYTATLAWLAKQISACNREIFLVPADAPDDAGIKADGDWCRLRRLFHSPVALGLIDQNGTLHYKRFVPRRPPVGLVSDHSEMWLKLKFPSLIDVLDPPRAVFDYTSSNTNVRGYVVSRSLSFNEALLDDMLISTLTRGVR